LKKSCSEEHGFKVERIEDLGRRRGRRLEDLGRDDRQTDRELAPVIRILPREI
jgi:hypothetical protein